MDYDINYLHTLFILLVTYTLSRDDPTGHETRREKERQTEKEMGR